MNETYALWIGNFVMALGGMILVAGLLTATAYVTNHAIRRLLDCYGGWKVFLQFRDWYHKQKEQS